MGTDAGYASNSTLMWENNLQHWYQCTVPGDAIAPLGTWRQIALSTEVGAGTVTSVAVTSANGFSCSVANPTTAANLTCSLGAITPTTIVASSTIGGSNLSGTNTGDQTTSGTAPISVATGTTNPVISCTPASGVVNGCLESADFVNFFNKEDSGYPVNLGNVFTTGATWTLGNQWTLQVAGAVNRPYRITNMPAEYVNGTDDNGARTIRYEITNFVDGGVCSATMLCVSPCPDAGTICNLPMSGQCDFDGDQTHAHGWPQGNSCTTNPAAVNWSIVGHYLP